MNLFYALYVEIEEETDRKMRGESTSRDELKMA
jgi:hypothetical protein